MSFYELVELASKSPVVKKYQLDPEVIVAFALVMDQHVSVKPGFNTYASHDKVPRVKLGRGNVSISKFAKILSKGMQEVLDDA